MCNNYIYHVHTYRCGHASKETDEEYVEKAVELQADSIAFTDHAPFPGDPFTNRMKYSQLNEYIDSLKKLKEKYKDFIDVRIGLEIEYIPSYSSYYKELRANRNLEILMLGQHHYEMSGGKYSFMEDDRTLEYAGICQAICTGIKTGLFDVVAHPDRAFRNCNKWTDELSAQSVKLIDTAARHRVKLEKNLSSIKNGQYRDSFWKLVPEDSGIIYGCDAHSVKELVPKDAIYLLGGDFDKI